MTDDTTEALPEQPEQPEQYGEPARPDAPRSWAAGRHPINVLHLVFAVAFAGLVVNWALVESSTVGGHGLRWLLPIPWVAAGAAGLIATAPRLRSR
jgi:hypothetical protein